VVEAPETLTVEEITNEANAEVRRIMLDRYGAERYITDLGAKRIQADDYGELFRVELEDDEPLVMVRVVNSTAEPDGSFKRYNIRVDPRCTSAHEAVAWTFGKDVEDYAPTVQT